MSAMSFYTLEDAARLLQCSVRTIQRGLHRIRKKSGPLRIVRLTEGEILKLSGAIG